jgi:hypothetical protein
MVYVRYRYEQEAEVIVDKADNYTITLGFDISGVEYYQVLGTYYDYYDKRRNIFIANGFPTPEFKPYIREYPYTSGVIPSLDGSVYWKGGRYDKAIDVDTGQIWGELDAKFPEFGFLECTGGLYRYSNTEASYQFYLKLISDGTIPPGDDYYFPPSTPPKQDLVAWRSVILEIYDDPKRSYDTLYFKRKPIDVDLQVLTIHPVGGRTKTLDIYQGNTKVFTRTEFYRLKDLVKLEVVGGCPTNTCPVLCGNGVCCYGSNGIAVSSYEY